MDFLKSETKINLMRAFAGESQARNRYDIAAKQAKREGLVIVEKLFKYVACQEQTHALVFYDHLKEANDDNLDICGGYPINNYSASLDHLKAAVHNETEEYEDVYKSFGDIAREEGFPVIAGSFELIAKIEKTHADRFAKYANRLENGTLFSGGEQQIWLCTNCGHIHIGPSAPKTCPVCHEGQGYFLADDLNI